MRRAIDERGIALIVVLMLTQLLLALGLALTIAAMTETAIAGHYRAGIEAFYAAEAAAARAARDLAEVEDWTEVASGRITSGFFDGPPGIARYLPDGTRLDLAGEPPGRALYASGPFRDLVPGAPFSPLYAVVWAAEGPGEGEPGEMRLDLLAQAYGPRGLCRGVQVTVARRPGEPRVRTVFWRDQADRRPLSEDPAGADNTR